MSTSVWIILALIACIIVVAILDNKRFEKGNSSLYFVTIMIFSEVTVISGVAFLASGFNYHYLIYIPIFGGGGLAFILLLRLIGNPFSSTPEDGKKLSRRITRNMRFDYNHNLFPELWIKGLKKALRLDSDNTEAKYLLAVIYEERGKKELAKEMMDELLSVEPGNPDYQDLKMRIEEAKSFKQGTTAR